MAERDLRRFLKRENLAPDTLEPLPAERPGSGGELNLDFSESRHPDMAWNEPGNGKDPWKRGDNKPTDLDQLVARWQQRLSGMLGGKGGGGKPGGGGSIAGGIILIVLLLVAWLFTGLYRVDEAERGVVQRFGAYTETTMPGLHWHLPFPIESVDARQYERRDRVLQYKTEMLTADEQYVFIDMVVQYRRTDPVLYSFEVVDPDADTARRDRERASREVVGTSTTRDPRDRPA